MISQLKIFVELTRLNKPIGIMLLFWPCSWSLSYSFSINNNLNQFIYFLILFFLGSLLMRSAGCIVNDIVDKDFDKKVERTKKRPLAANKISVVHASIYVIFLCLISFFILIQFNKLTIILGMISMLFAFVYPFMKKITYWPQLFLGLTFNWGIIMGFAAAMNNISYEIFLLYTAAIFWTIGYDTIYGAQDIKDDEIIGVKSTAIKFKKNIKLFISINYFFSLSFLLLFFKNKIGLNYSTIFIVLFIMSLIYQILLIKKKKPKKYLISFRLNNYSGLFIFLAFLLIK